MSDRAPACWPWRILRTTCAVPAAVMLALLVQGGLPAAAVAQGWNPFAENAPPGSARPSARPSAGAPRGQPAEPPSGYASDAVPGQSSPREAVERSDLPPLPGQEEPGTLAPDVAQPATARAPAGAVGAAPATAQSDAAARLARIAPELPLPMRSAALGRLLVELLGPTAGDAASPEDAAARAVALYRAGRVAEADAIILRSVAGHANQGGPAAAVLAAASIRLALAVGDFERACAPPTSGASDDAQLPAALRAQVIAIGGWCGVRAGNPAAAGLAASLARELGGLPADTLAGLDALSVGEAPALQDTKNIAVLDWRLAEAAARWDSLQLPLDRLEPAALVAVAMSRTAPARLRVPAAEAAARLNAIDPATLAEVYRQQAFTPADLAEAAAGRGEPWSRRAALFRAAEAERTPFKRTRLVRAALDDSRRSGLYPAMAAAMARVIEDVRAVPEIGWFAETAVEVMLAAGRLGEARRWAGLGLDVRGETSAPATLGHWLALIDIADPSSRERRGAMLGSVEEMALRGRFTPEGLHRLATVLDALDYHVPVRLWEAASRAPQPTTGHLPPTGVLSDLQAAARARDPSRTAVMVFRALGPDGPEGAHMIALGDAIRALRRVGLEAHARAIAAEALFALWPRVVSG